MLRSLGKVETIENDLDTYPPIFHFANLKFKNITLETIQILPQMLLSTQVQI